MNVVLSDFTIAALSNAVLVIPLAAMVAVICRFVRRPTVAWCLWGLVLLKFVTPAWGPLAVRVAWLAGDAAELAPAPTELPTDFPVPAWEPVADVVSDWKLGNEGADLSAEWLTDDLWLAVKAASLVTRKTEVVDLEGPPPPPLPIRADDGDQPSVSVAESFEDGITTGAQGAPRSQAPAWEPTSEKLRFTFPRAMPDSTDRLAKQSFADRRSQTESEDEEGEIAAARPVPIVPLFFTGWAFGSIVLLLLAMVRVRRFGTL
ncbi:MAG: hypothetical protein KF861_18610, partial [Planctomycetaceae bacterium]|nr:hypothetical protein [Planctomycetaceae bacterium]